MLRHILMRIRSETFSNKGCRVANTLTIKLRISWNKTAKGKNAAVGNISSPSRDFLEHYVARK
jgi:hypothetical protein